MARQEALGSLLEPGQERFAVEIGDLDTRQESPPWPRWPCLHRPAKSNHVARRRAARWDSAWECKNGPVRPPARVTSPRWAAPVTSATPAPRALWLPLGARK